MELKISRGGSSVEAPPELMGARLLTIGSDPAADLTLEDEKVSPCQVRLTRRGALWWLHEVDRATGTGLNGSPVTGAQLLQDGDVLSLGDHEVSVELEEGEKQAAAASKGAADPGAAREGQAHLRLETGVTYPLDQDSFLIGKDEGCDLRLSGWSAPGHLAVIVRGQQGHYVLNLAGGSAVLHQSKPVESSVELKQGDCIQLRDLYATFRTGPCPSE